VINHLAHFIIINVLLYTFQNLQGRVFAKNYLTGTEVDLKVYYCQVSLRCTLTL